jgi:hypothetical protein
LNQPTILEAVIESHVSNSVYTLLGCGKLSVLFLDGC